MIFCRAIFLHVGERLNILVCFGPAKKTKKKSNKKSNKQYFFDRVG